MSDSSKGSDHEPSGIEGASGDGEADEYKVGNCKPPLHSRFQPNNKFGKGRKKGSKSLKRMVREAMETKAPAKVGGKIKKLPRIELMIHHCAIKGSQGDPKASDKAMALYERYGPEDDLDGPEPEKLRLDRKTLKALLKMQDLIDPEDDEEAGDV